MDVDVIMGVAMKLIIVCALIGVLGIIEGLRECRDFVVTRYTIVCDKKKKTDVLSTPPKLLGHIAVISDLHNKEYGKENERLLARIRREQPELIMIPGDILVAKNMEPIDTAVRFMKELVKIAPVYYGNGNHEQRMKESAEIYGEEYEIYKRELLEAGVYLLENESTMISIGGKQVCVTGLEIPLKYYERGNAYDFTVNEVEQVVGTSSESYQILLAHHPQYSEQYVEWGADLVLSGHLHGGIVRVPKLGAVITPQFRLFPKYNGGCYGYHGADIVVSKGMGEHTIKLRILNRPELIILSLVEGDSEAV